MSKNVSYALQNLLLLLTGEFVCWQVNLISLSATVADSFQSDLIHLILMIDVSVSGGSRQILLGVQGGVSVQSEGHIKNNILTSNTLIVLYINIINYFILHIKSALNETLR